jgi:hypothetical protein
VIAGRNQADGDQLGDIGVNGYQAPIERSEVRITATRKMAEIGVGDLPMTCQPDDDVARQGLIIRPEFMPRQGLDPVDCTTDVASGVAGSKEMSNE